MTKEWYGVLSVVHHPRINSEVGYVYEERVVLIQAADMDDAIRLGEEEARAYADRTGAYYCQFVNAFHLFDSTIGSGTEVYSIMRDSPLAADAYLDRFVDTGHERTQTHHDSS